MKTVFKTSIATVLMAAWAATGTGVQAQGSSMPENQSCEPILASVQYAKTRIGNFCLFKGSWVCYAEFTPDTNCDKAPSDTGLGEG